MHLWRRHTSKMSLHDNCFLLSRLLCSELSGGIQTIPRLGIPRPIKQNIVGTTTMSLRSCGQMFSDIPIDWASPYLGICWILSPESLRIPRTILRPRFSYRFHTADKCYLYRGSRSHGTRVASEPVDIQMPVVINQTVVSLLIHAAVEPPSLHRYPHSTNLAAHTAARYPVVSVPHTFALRSVRLHVDRQSVIPNWYVCLLVCLI